MERTVNFLTMLSQMTLSAVRRPLRCAILAASVAALAGGCAGTIPTNTKHETPYFGAPVTDNHTPYSVCLGALAKLPAQNAPVIAVGDIKDKTGQMSNSNYTESTMLTQGVSEMLISALYKTQRVGIAERMDLSIPMTEKQLAEMGLLADTAPGLKPTPVNFIVLGALTELNYNILSGGVRLFINGIGGGVREAIINVGLDLRIVDVRTFQTVYATSLQKQIIGFEVETGVFSFFGNNLVEFDAGALRNEPLQVGVRSVVEMGVLQILTEGFGLPTPENCDLVKVARESGELNSFSETSFQSKGA